MNQAKRRKTVEFPGFVTSKVLERAHHTFYSNEIFLAEFIAKSLQKNGCVNRSDLNDILDKCQVAYTDTLILALMQQGVEVQSDVENSHPDL